MTAVNPDLYLSPSWHYTSAGPRLFCYRLSSACPNQQAAACPKGSAFLALDMDRDGRIDYEEWLLFLALLSIPTEDIQGRAAPGLHLSHACLVFAASACCSLRARTEKAFSLLSTPFPPPVAFHMVDANHSGSIEVLELEALLVSLRKRYCKILPHTGNPPVGDTSRYPWKWRQHSAMDV